MTTLQNERFRAREEARSNAAKERLEESKQAETARTNKANEQIKRTKNRIDMAGQITKSIGDFGKVVGAINDPSWYNFDKQMVKDVASLSFGAPLGSVVPDDYYTVVSDTSGTQYTFDQVTRKKLPGIMILNFSPTAGNTGGSSSDNMALNIVAKNIYSYVRYANSGSRNYEAADLMMYLLAMDGIISYRANLMRLYSLLLSAKAENWYYSKYLIKALGYDYDDLVKHIPELRSYINVLGARMCSFYVATDLPIYQRHAWLNVNIFKDSNIKKSQEYMFNQTNFWKWKGSMDVGTYLEATVLPLNSNDLVGYDQIVSFGNDLITALISDEDVGIISGDILKAYGDSAKLKETSMPSDFHVESIFSMEVLSQITNATVIGPCTDATGLIQSNSVVQNSNGIITMGYVANKAVVEGISVHGSELTWNTPSGKVSKDLTPTFSDKLINMYKDEVSPDDVMVATRLICGVTSETGAKFTTTNPVLDFYGTEIVNTVTIYQAYANNVPIPDTRTALREYNFVNYQDVNIDFGGINEAARAVASFDWAPHITFNVGVFSESTHLIMNISDNRDICNFSIASNKNISSMHDIATLSMYRVPVTNMQSVKRY